jgi:hypothetical protein
MVLQNPFQANTRVAVHLYTPQPLSSSAYIIVFLFWNISAKWEKMFILKPDIPANVTNKYNPLLLIATLQT